jgi:hypothetical protein
MGDLMVGGRVILKLILEEQTVRCEPDSTGSG